MAARDQGDVPGGSGPVGIADDPGIAGRGLMRPTSDQIQHAAYERWLRRGRIHGHHDTDWYGAEKELAFHLNYRTIAEYPLASEKREGAGRSFDPAVPLLRADGRPGPVAAGRRAGSLGEICPCSRPRSATTANRIGGILSMTSCVHSGKPCVPMGSGSMHTARRPLGRSSRSVCSKRSPPS